VKKDFRIALVARTRASGPRKNQKCERDEAAGRPRKSGLTKESFVSNYHCLPRNPIGVASARKWTRSSLSQTKEGGQRKENSAYFSLASEELNPRDLRRLPAAANGLDQQHAGSHSARQNIYSGNFIRQRRALRRGHFQIICDASLIAVQRKRDRMFSGSDRAIFGLRLLLENAQRGKIVLHILERGQNSLAVVRNVLVVRGSRLFGNSAAFAGIKQRFNRCPSERPQSLGP